MDDDGLRVSPELCIPQAEIHESASRSSGPGGQHVNKSETRVTLRWSVRESAVLDPAQRRRLLARLAPRLTRRGQLVVHAQRFRSRARNRAMARERLAELVRDALQVQRSRVATGPSRGSVQRRLETKRRRAVVKRTRRPPRDEA